MWWVTCVRLGMKLGQKTNLQFLNWYNWSKKCNLFYRPPPSYWDFLLYLFGILSFRYCLEKCRYFLLLFCNIDKKITIMKRLVRFCFKDFLINNDKNNLFFRCTQGKLMNPAAKKILGSQNLESILKGSRYQKVWEPLT